MLFDPEIEPHFSTWLPSFSRFDERVPRAGSDRMNIIFGFGRARNRSISQMCTIILSLVFIWKSRYSFSRVWCMLRVWGYEWDIWLLKRFTKFSFFFAKDVIISIFHHCEIRICYLGRSRLSFTRTSMKWKIIGSKNENIFYKMRFLLSFLLFIFTDDKMW